MLNRRRKHRQLFNVSVLFTIFRTAAWHQTSSTIHQPVANWPISVLTTFINTKQNEIYRVFSLTWPAYMQIYWNKRKRLHKKRVQLPEDWFGTPTWPPFHCSGTLIWPPWLHVKTLYMLVSEIEIYWKLPADESDSRIRSIALVSDWNKFIFSVSPKKREVWNYYSLLSLNIHIRILWTDIHVLPLRISWENLVNDHGILSIPITNWKNAVFIRIDAVTRKLGLEITFET